MQSLENKEKIRMASQEDAASCVNVTGTDRKIDAWLTYPVFPVRSSSGYYRAALMPVIRAAVARLEGRS